MKIYLIITSYIICIGPAFCQNDTASIGAESAYYPCNEPDIIDTSIINYVHNKVYFHFNQEELQNDIKPSNRKLLDKGDPRFFSGYLINTTDSTFKAIRQDGSLMMIKEAQDENGKWKAIEYWVPSGCGNSYFDPLILESGKTVLFPVWRDKGDFKTNIRLRIKYSFKDDAIVSSSYEGSIYKSQFQKPTGSVYGILYGGDAMYLGAE